MHSVTKEIEKKEKEVKETLYQKTQKQIKKKGAQQ